MKIQSLHNPWISASDFAEKHGVTTRTLRRWVKAGKLEQKDHNGRTFYRRPDSPHDIVSPPPQADIEAGHSADIRVLLSELSELTAQVAKLTAAVERLQSQSAPITQVIEEPIEQPNPKPSSSSVAKSLVDALRASEEPKPPKKKRG